MIFYLVSFLFVSVTYTCPLPNDVQEFPTNAAKVRVDGPLFATGPGPSIPSTHKKMAHKPSATYTLLTGNGSNWPNQNKWVSYDQM